MNSVPVHLGHMNALVVDDNAYHRAVVIEVLRGAGCQEVLTASNGMEGLEVFRKQRPQIVLVDWLMDPIDGPTFTMLLRRHDNPLVRSTPVIMLTARSRRNDVEEARAVGVDDLLIKPVNPELLLKKVHDAIARPRRFVDSAAYAGPCRRRHLDLHYAGPRRRRADNIPARSPINAPAPTDRRAPLQASVQRLTDSMTQLQTGAADRRAVLGAAQETAALAGELRDQPLHRGAQALARYVESTTELNGSDPVLHTHAAALCKLMQTGESKSAERTAVAEALEHLVKLKVTRAR